MQKIGRLFFILFFLCQITLVDAALANVTLKVEVTPDAVGVGEQVQVLVTVQSNDDFEIAEPQLNEVAGLRLLQAQNAGQSSSTRMNIVNGKTEFSKTVQQQFVYIFEAIKKGLITLPSVKVNVNGQDYQSAPQTFSVSEKPLNQRNLRQRNQPQGEPMDPFADEDDMFVQLMKQRQQMMDEVQKQLGGGGRGFGGAQPFGGLGVGQPSQIPSRKLDINTNEAFFILLETDKTTVYEGEQVTANWYLYSQSQIESLDRAKFPDLKGFWKEIIEEVPSLRFEQEIVNGLMYKKALLASHALFPIKPGQAVIDEFKIKAKVRMLTPNGYGQLSEYTKSSRRQVIKVLPLPSENKPLSFSGAVGQFQIQTQVDGIQFPTGQPFLLRLRFEGQGNAKLIELPPIDWPEGLEIYDTKSESKFFKNGQSYKEFEIYLIAKNKGSIQIPKISFSYFDPNSKTYVTKITETLTLDISEAVAGQSQNIIRPNNQQATSEQAQKIILPVAQLNQSQISWAKMKWPFLDSLTGAVLVYFLVFGLIQFRQLNTAPPLKNLIDKKIKLIQAAIRKNDYKSFAAESINTVYLLAAYLAREKNASEDWVKLVSKMPENYRLKFEVQLGQFLDVFQIIGFAPDRVREQVLASRSLSQIFEQFKLVTDKIIIELMNDHL